MKKYLKNIMAVVFLTIFLPYTITLLMGGRQGIHQEEELPAVEYQVLHRMLEGNCSWMEDGTLQLMAVLYRTECVRTEDVDVSGDVSYEQYEESYERMHEAVVHTQGQVITIKGEYRELPYHEVSAGKTRQGTLLGEAFSYVRAAECSEDLESDQYLQICVLGEEEVKQTLGSVFDPEHMELRRDSAGYVTELICPEGQWQGESVRKLLHLPSSCFFMEPVERGIRITVKGNGHGFGISLYTADRMIRQGDGIQEIIQKFYEDAECITLP